MKILRIMVAIGLMCWGYSVLSMQKDQPAKKRRFDRFASEPVIHEYERWIEPGVHTITDAETKAAAKEVIAGGYRSRSSQSYITDKELRQAHNEELARQARIRAENIAEVEQEEHGVPEWLRQMRQKRTHDVMQAAEEERMREEREPIARRRRVQPPALRRLPNPSSDLPAAQRSDAEQAERQEIMRAVEEERMQEEQD